MFRKISGLLRDREKVREPALYILFGALTTLVNWLVYFAVTRALGIGGMERETAPYVLAANTGNAVAWVAAVIFAFLTNKKYVFRSGARAGSGAWKEFWLFVSARLLSLVIFDVALFNLLLYFGMNADWDKLLMNALVILFNYFASSLVIFKKSGSDEAEENKNQ